MREDAKNKHRDDRGHEVGRTHALHRMRSGAGGQTEGQPQPIVKGVSRLRGEAVQAVLHTNRERGHSDARVSLTIRLDHAERSHE